jgi:hypothetical protein
MVARRVPLSGGGGADGASTAAEVCRSSGLPHYPHGRPGSVLTALAQWSCGSTGRARRGGDGLAFAGLTATARSGLGPSRGGSR